MKTFLSLLFLTAAALPAVAQEAKPMPDMDMHKAKAFTLPTELVAQTTCPISGEELEDKEHFIDYEGHRIYTCCDKCKKKVSMKPEQVALGMYAKGIQLENIQTTCPVSGEELEDHDTFVKLYNKTIYVCCNKCKKKVEANPAKYLDVMAGRHAQDGCAYSGEELDPEAAFVVDGMAAGACCGKCVKKAQAAPATFFSKLEKDHVVLEPATMKCPVMPGMDGSKKYPVTLGSRRYYLCSEKAAVMFAANPGKFLPKWLEVQGAASAVPSALDALGGSMGDADGCEDCGTEGCEDCGNSKIGS